MYVCVYVCIYIYIYIYIYARALAQSTCTTEVVIRSHGGQGSVNPTDTMASDDLDALRNRALEARILAS